MVGAVAKRDYWSLGGSSAGARRELSALESRERWPPSAAPPGSSSAGGGAEAAGWGKTTCAGGWTFGALP